MKPVRTGEIGIIGFCWGAPEFRYATNAPQLRPFVVCYGPSPNAADMGRSARKARGLRRERPRIQRRVPDAAAAMEGGRQGLSLHRVSGVGHGFLRTRENRKSQTARGMPRSILPGAAEELAARGVGQIGARRSSEASLPSRRPRPEPSGSAARSRRHELVPSGNASRAAVTAPSKHPIRPHTVCPVLPRTTSRRSVRGRPPETRRGSPRQDRRCRGDMRPPRPRVGACSWFGGGQIMPDAC